MTNDIILSARDVKRDYLQAGTDKKLSVICNLSLDIVRGQTLAIVGVSGSGKTTLLNLLGGIDDACAGSVSVAGKDWKELSAVSGQHGVINMWVLCISSIIFWVSFPP